VANPEIDRVNERMTLFQEACRSTGLRVTHQRLEVFRELARFPGHPSAEEVYARVKRRLPTISLDTVYRTIATFEKHHLVTRVQTLDHKARFDGNLDRHHHLVCVRCKRIEDFYWPEFDRMAPPRATASWGNIDIKSVELRGLCRRCRRHSR